jgi:hypothetical protein
MKSWVLAAGLMAAMVAPPAMAADLDGGPPPPSYKFGYDDDDRPPASKRYSEAPPYGRHCVRSDDVRRRLTSFGWQDFHAGQPQGDLVTLRARRPSGRLFELTLHRCTGEIVEVQPLEPRRYGRFAFRHHPRFEDFDEYRPPRRWRWDY